MWGISPKNWYTASFKLKDNILKDTASPKLKDDLLKDTASPKLKNDPLSFQRSFSHLNIFLHIATILLLYLILPSIFVCTTVFLARGTSQFLSPLKQRCSVGSSGVTTYTSFTIMTLEATSSFWVQA